METISDYKYDIHKEIKNLEIIEEDLTKKLNDFRDQQLPLINQQE